MINKDNFLWVDFYTEFANKLLQYKDDRKTLIEKIKHVYEVTDIKLPTLERDNKIIDIDPFTVFALFNKQISLANRIKLLEVIEKEFSVQKSVPKAFDGIPVVNNMSATFYWFVGDRKDDDIDNLWDMFVNALNCADDQTEENEESFIEIYDRVIKQNGIRWNLSMGLFWIRPYTYINLDATNKAYIETICPEIAENKVKQSSKLFDATTYLEITKTIKNNVQSGTYEFANLPELSFVAFEEAERKSKEIKKGEHDEWWPSLEYYNPNISAEDWIKYLTEIEMVEHSTPMKMLKAMMELGGEASCKELSLKYGGKTGTYIGSAVSLGKRVKNYFGLSACMEGELERFFVYPFLGQHKKGDKYYTYRIRPELLEALKTLDLSKYDPHYSEDDEGSATNYWFVSANPKLWSFSQIGIGETVDFTLYNENGNKRRIFQNYLDAKKGDVVICYESTPVLQIVALGKVVKEHNDKEIVIEKTEILSTPIDYAILRDSEELQETEFLTNKNGSFFRLTSDEYSFIMDLIREENPIAVVDNLLSYAKKDFLNDVYMTESDYETLMHLLENKQNIILQGAPGVGKTYAAKRLAYSIMGVKDESKIEFVQFHQNYSYEDFVMGYKPKGETFEIENGIFYRFCQKAASKPNDKFYFIIDEINRGNMSKIFGELMMLIEKGYRETKATLAYSGMPFSVPKNLYIIGMMNTADRSLAMIDYALRRRFSFFDMQPGFDSEGFKRYQASLNNEKFDKLIKTVCDLNNAIAEDNSLGKGFQIGHSYFCEQMECTLEWMKEVVEYDIIPMLNEYWFDNKSEVDKWAEILRGVLR